MDPFGEMRTSSSAWQRSTPCRHSPSRTPCTPLDTVEPMAPHLSISVVSIMGALSCTASGAGTSARHSCRLQGWSVHGSKSCTVAVPLW